MYTLSKGPSKIVASARRGPPRQLDFEGYDTREKKSLKSPQSDSGSGDQSSPEMSSPLQKLEKPVFQHRNPSSMKKPQRMTSQDMSIQENHNEMINLLSRQWNKVEKGTKENKHGETVYEIYREKEATDLKNFQPFDLERYWGKKALNTALGKQPSS